MQPAVGQKLYLRSNAPVRPELAKNNTTVFGKNENAVAGRLPQTPGITKETISYTVQPKETIYSISKKYNVKIDDLVQWNQLTSFDLKTGQQLRIYK